MGKIIKNKVAPRKDKPKKNNWVKGKNQKTERYKDAAKEVHKNTKKESFPDKHEQPVKVKSVKEDPFFITASSSKDGPSTGTRAKTIKDKFTFRKDSNKTNDGGEKGGNTRKSLTMRRSKYFTLKKSNEATSDYVPSPSTSGKFSVKNKDAESPQTESGDKPTKTFDKKKWRMQKYSKRYKLEQWEEKRKKAILRGYFKDTKGNDNKFDVQKIYEENPSSDDENATDDAIDADNENNLNSNIVKERASTLDNIETLNTSKTDSQQEQPTNSKNKKSKAFKKAQSEYERIKNEKKQRREELERKRKERDEALKIYKQKKVEKYKKLSRRTKRGQPIMKDHIEVLLEKIQKNLGRS